MEPAVTVSIFVSVVIALIASSIWINAVRRKRRREYVYGKYGRTEIAERILHQMFWVGQTEDELADSLGRPASIDRKILKTKSKEIWKYNRITSRTFGLRITVENGIVVGWDKKGQ